MKRVRMELALVPSKLAATDSMANGWTVKARALLAELVASEWMQGPDGKVRVGVLC